ncbi:MAG: T9SS type A sorting domain-containing protein [Flavobacteriales bacterium]
MRKIYFSTIAAFIAISVNAQNPTITFSSDNICAGETITATVTGAETSLASSAADNNANNGVMFDLVGEAGAIIKGFTVNTETTASMEIYYRTGSYAGFEDSNVGWTLLGSSTGVALGTGVNTGVELDLEILPGQTLGFYITCTSGSEFIQYADGTSVGTELGSDDYISILSGVGKSYPFAATNTPRDFIGSVIYEPVPTFVYWNVSSSDTNIVEFTPTKTQVVSVVTTANGTSLGARKVVTVNDYQVEATADPAVLGWNESSTLTADVTLSTGLATTFEGISWSDGAMFDLSATSELSVTGFAIATPNVAGDVEVEVFYKTGSYVGFQANAGAWTSLGTSTIPTGAGEEIELASSVMMAAGQTMAFYITRLDGEHIGHVSGTSVGAVYSSDSYISIKEGITLEHPFGAESAFPRVPRCIVYYEVENPAGLNYSWSESVGTNASETVMPNADVTYVVTVDNGDCETTADVSVSMAVGIDEAIAENISVYPNPATENITIQSENVIEVESISLMDATGKIVQAITPGVSFSTVTIPVNQLAKGVYLLQLNMAGGIVNHRLMVQ